MLKNLKSLFFTTEEDSTTDNTTSEKKTNPDQGKSGNTVNDMNSGNSAGSTPVVDNAILEKLLSAIEENNQSGFDYLEYRRSLKSLETFPMDEATKFRSSYATASTMGVTVEKLLESIEFYKKVLKSEEIKFKKTIEEQYSINVEKKLKDKEALNIKIQEKSKMIQNLTEEIRKHQSEMTEIDSFVSAAEEKIKTTDSHFNASYSVLETQMEQDKNKIKEYLK